MVQSSDRLFTAAFVSLTLSELAYFTAAGLVIGITPFFVAGPLGSDEAALGLVAGAFGVTTLLLRPFAGRLADRRGRRPLLVGGALLFAFVVLAHTLSVELWMLVVLRLLLGVAEAFYFVAGIAALADLAPPGRAGEALSYNSLALYLGIAFGPLIGQQLLDGVGFGGAWLGAAGLALLATVLALRVPETSHRAAGEAPPVALIHRAAVGPGLALFAGVAAMTGFLLLGGPHAERVGFETWSIVFLVFGAVVVACRIALARLPDRVPPMRLAGAALAICGAGLVAAAWSPGPIALLTGTAMIGLGVALLTPAIFAAIFGLVPPGERGAAAGTATLFIDLGFSGGPLAFGVVAATAGIPEAFLVAAAVALIGSAGTFVGRRLSRVPAIAA